jgi:hypothetical protein
MYVNRMKTSVCWESMDFMIEQDESGRINRNYLILAQLW